MKRRVNVVALIIPKEDEILVERRRLDRKIDQGAITIPGGHVEEGETFKEACRRELKEELGLKCTHFRYLAMHLHETPFEDQVTRYYVCKNWTGSPEPIEAAEIFFIDVDETERLDFEIDRKALIEFYRRENVKKA